ncbi:hypothetical protein [Bacillus thuringiensis]|uniref:hypothetical protein n=1 Tax=Bacillus thuringiensis TaxID=1428 RepID=UPI0034588B8D
MKKLLFVISLMSLLSGCVDTETQKMPEDTPQQRIEKQQQIEQDTYDDMLDTATQMMMTTVILG